MSTRPSLSIVMLSNIRPGTLVSRISIVPPFCGSWTSSNVRRQSRLFIKGLMSAVVEQPDDGLVLSVRTGDNIFERHLAEPRQLPGFAGVRTGDDPCPCPSKV